MKTATKLKVEYQVSDHGCGRKSVQLFDYSGKLIRDASIVKDVNGWRVVSLNSNDMCSDQPQHNSPESAAIWFATVVSYTI